MGDPQVEVFFYGSYINPDVLAEVDLAPARMETAWLPGWDIEIRPLANLVPSDRHTVYGVIATATNAELERLYAHAREVLGGVYLPRAVLVYTGPARAEPALCYMAPEMGTAPASRAYVERIAGPARRFGFPEWYVERIEGFAP